jgi:uroporphyrinogen-III synthase
MRLLVTRPEPGASRTAQAVRARGHAVLAAPLLRIEALEPAFGACAGVLITSANAARAIAPHPRIAELCTLPLIAVGARTAEAARAAGFTQVEAALGAVSDLAALAGSRFRRGARLLHLAGEDRAGDLAGDLGAAGVAVETVTVYRAVAVADLPTEAAAALAGGTLDGALHYSQRSAATALRLAERAGVLNPLLNLAQYCLSGEVAVPLHAAGAARVAVAPRPDEAALFGLIAP